MADEAACTLPFLVCDAQPVDNISAALTLPMLLAYGADVEWDGEADLTLLPIGMEAEAIDGPGGSASISMPLFTLAAESSYVAEIDLPVFTLAASAYEIAYGSFDAPLPVLELSSEGYTERDGTASVTLPGLRLAASVGTGAIAEADLTLPMPRLVAVGESGSDGTADLDLPQLTISALSGEPITGTADIDLLPLWLEAHGYTTPAEVYRTWVMHLGNAAVTEYTEFDFTSYMVFAGEVYAAGADGIYKLDDSDTDAGTDIDSAWEHGNYNFEDSHTKRVPRMYWEVKMLGDMRATTEVAVGGARSYGLYYDGVDSQRTRRVPIGRGPRSVYWTFGGANVAGSDFELSRILVHPEVTRRRVF